MREARRSQWPFPLASRATKQTARKAPSLRVAAKCGVCVVALLGFVVLATTFVARLASIRILLATQFAEDLIRGSLELKLTAQLFRERNGFPQLAVYPHYGGFAIGEFNLRMVLQVNLVIHRKMLRPGLSL